MSRAPPGVSLESDVFEGAPHPRLARTLIGHAEAEAALLDGRRSERLAHAWLIGGPRGIGKATLAWRFARFVLAHPDPASPAVRAARDLAVDPEAPAARQVAALSHPDLAILRRNWNADRKTFFTEISVHDVRDALRLFQLSAGFGGWRICIVDCADDLNRSSANALLKMIEEPPPRSLFLIVAHRPAQVLATIRSRCRRLNLQPLNPDEIARVVGGLGEPWSEIAPPEIAEAAETAQGSVREALERLDPDASKIQAAIATTLASLPECDWRQVHRLADAVAKRDAADGFEALMVGVLDWLDARARRDAALGAPRLAPIADAWEKIRVATRDTEAYNLDKRLHVLAIFAELSAAARRL